MLFAVGSLLLFFCSLQSKAQSSPEYTKEGLQKIKWIEGNWAGLYEGKPFYEIYRFTNDTTLEITSYEWNGKDSTNSSKTFLRWYEGAYYLGDSLNWKATQISSSHIKMIPHRKAANEILWKHIDRDAWDAVLTSKRGETLYNMKRVRHFSK